MAWDPSMLALLRVLTAILWKGMCYQRERALQSHPAGATAGARAVQPEEQPRCLVFVCPGGFPWGREQVAPRAGAKGKRHNH